MENLVVKRNTADSRHTDMGKQKNGEVSYYITQMLPGHGYFRKYMHRMGKCSSPYCIYEEKETLDNATNIVQIVSSSEGIWNVAKSYVEYIIRTKKLDLDAIE